MSERIVPNAARDPAYERDKRLAADPDVEVRRTLAQSQSARPEILYYLAGDTAPAVRREIAANRATPVHADVLLARDPDESVRAGLARKVAMLLPTLPPEAQSDAERRIVEMVETLARDQAVHVRQVIAETLKDVADAPPAVMRRLARDAELVVAEPVLRCSPVLTDEDLLDIIASAPVAGALAAIAGRNGLAATVSDAIVAADDDTAIAALLANPSAQIREETLDLVVDRAPAHPSWHSGLVARPALPARVARRIASFVAASLLQQLEQRADLDVATRQAVSAEVARRLESDTGYPDQFRPAVGAAGESAAEIVARLKAQGALDENAVATALEEGRRAVAKAALAALSGLGDELVDKILTSRSATGIVALAWKAGLSPRLATPIQLRLGGIAPKQLLAARRGDTWPLTPEDMTWHLEFFGA